MATLTPPIPEESLTPEQLRAMLREAIQRGLEAFDSDDFQIVRMRLADDEQKLASKARNKLYRLRVKLDNQALAEIRDQLKTNEPALLDATASLRESAQRVERVAELIESAGSIVTLATRILSPL